MNDIFTKALQAVGKRAVNTPVVPLVKQTTLQNMFARKPSGIDPGSFYGAYKENPQSALEGAVMSMATPTLPFNKLANLSTTDREIMGRFVEAVESGQANKAMGQLGNDVQNIAQGLGINTMVKNKTLAEYFNKLIQQADKLGIKPLRD